jgi:hypothetical protein
MVRLFAHEGGAIRTTSLRATVSVSGKRNFEARDKRAQDGLSLKSALSRDWALAVNAANSGQLALR